MGGNGQLLAGFPREMRESNFVCLHGIATICFLLVLLVPLPILPRLVIKIKRKFVCSYLHLHFIIWDGKSRHFFIKIQSRKKNIFFPNAKT